MEVGVIMDQIVIQEDSQAPLCLIQGIIPIKGYTGRKLENPPTIFNTYLCISFRYTIYINMYIHM